MNKNLKYITYLERNRQFHPNLTFLIQYYTIIVKHIEKKNIGKYCFGTKDYAKNKILKEMFKFGQLLKNLNICNYCLFG